ETPGPRTKRRQPTVSDPDERAAISAKVSKVINRRYVVKTSINIRSLIKFFAVPKGENDIRIVYDATANALNECIWVPSFWLPTVDTLLRALDAESWMADRDISDMFLNFQLHHAVMSFTGLDLSQFLEDAENTAFDKIPTSWYHWDRNLMGFAPSPYNSVKMALVAEEVICGDRHDLSNPFHWNKVEVNLPGMVTYNPSRSWCAKIRTDGRLACDLFTFIDDERITGPSEELTWKAGHTVAAKQSYLGIQDAARKVRSCSKNPGAWAGSVVHVVPEKGVCVLTSEDKWKRLRLILQKWLERLEAGEEELSHKELLSDRGFMVYVTRNYPAMVPYLKGFHLTVEMWRGGRDEEGWKLPKPTLGSLGTADDASTSAAMTLVDSGVAPLTEESCGPLVASVEDEDEAAANYRIARQASKETLYRPTTGKTRAVPRLLEDVRAL
ncbi:hypothetical protein ACHAXS_000255, partial [Conticribra weissflogii]